VAGEDTKSRLHQEVRILDDRLSEAFNAHDVDAVMTLFSQDVEFYHDIEGLQSFGQIEEASRGLFAKDNGIRRELVPGTLRVYPVPNFGAIELGTHRFCHEENGESDCGTFEFVHVWRRQENNWKLVRVVSYGHQ